MNVIQGALAFFLLNASISKVNNSGGSTIINKRVKYFLFFNINIKCKKSFFIFFIFIFTVVCKMISLLLFHLYLNSVLRKDV